MAKSMVKVDADKFYAEMLKKKLDHRAVAEQMGYAKSYFTSQLSPCKSKNGYSLLPKNVPMLLKNLYNVNPETYLITDETASVKEEQSAPAISINYDKLREAIYLGVKEGIKEAAIEVDFTTVIRDGMVSALCYDGRKKENQNG